MFTLYLTITTATVALVGAVDFEIYNNAGGDIWVGTQTNDNKPALMGGGFVLGKGQSKVVNAPGEWAGRFWARTWCDSNSKHCLTGDCGNSVQCQGRGGAPPASLAEIKLKGHAGQDFYDISLVDGFNLPVVFQPIGGRGQCRTISCKYSFNDCPKELRLNGPKGLIGCKSACEALRDPKYCCTGAYGTAPKCPPTKYSQYFKQHCPDAYSYAYDDHTSTNTCLSNKYKVTFG